MMKICPANTIQEKITQMLVAKGFLTALLLFLVIGFSSCATSPYEAAEEAYSMGDYEKAIERALIILKENPGMAEADQILIKAWFHANDQWTAAIKALEESESPWEVEQAIPLYNKLLYIHNLAKTAEKNTLNPDPEGIYELVRATRKRSADLHAAEGSRLIVSGARMEAREALKHFERAAELIPDYPDIEAKLEQARELSLARVFVFTAPDTNITLNGVEMIETIERELGRSELVEIVTVPSRYAAPIGDSHGAEDLARIHGANLMLHVAPDTESKAAADRVVRDIDTAVGVDWQMEELSLIVSASANIRYVLIDLDNGTTIADKTMSISDQDDGGFSVSAILHSGDKQNLKIGRMSSSRSLLVNSVTPGLDPQDLSFQISVAENIEMPAYGFETGVRPALSGSDEKIDLGSYTHPSELAQLAELNGHTFWLFDVMEFDPSDDGDFSYWFPYGQYIGEGDDGRLASAAYDRQLYSQLIDWMNGQSTQYTVMNSFMPGFYTRTMPQAVAKEAAQLL